MHIFLYDDLMNSRKLKELCRDIVILSVVPGFTDGEMIDSERMKPHLSRYTHKSRYPIMLHKMPRHFAFNVFGALFEVEDDIDVFKHLDSFYSCSMYSLGDNKPSDMFHREMAKVSTISFENTSEFLKYRYEVEERGIKAYTYFGNPKNPAIGKKLKHIGQNRIGVVWKNFFNIFT